MPGHAACGQSLTGFILSDSQNKQGLSGDSKQACLGMEAISRESTTLLAASTAASTLGRTYSCTCKREAEPCVTHRSQTLCRQGANSCLQPGTHIVMHLQASSRALTEHSGACSRQGACLHSEMHMVTQLQACTTALCHDALWGILQA